MLASLSEFWEHWGFEPWFCGALAGVSRMQRFVKDGFLGRIAEYRARDYIVWDSGGEREREALWLAVRPMPEVMTQRFVFLLSDPWPGRRIRSFLFGFRGYVEFYGYNPLEPEGAVITEARDLTELVHMGLRYRATGRAAKSAPRSNSHPG